MLEIAFLNWRKTLLNYRKHIGHLGVNDTAEFLMHICTVQYVGQKSLLNQNHMQKYVSIYC